MPQLRYQLTEMPSDSISKSFPVPGIESLRPLLLGTRHMAVAGHYGAAHAAFAVLESGGNAVDAGVAAGIALGVLQSDLVNIAGKRTSLAHLNHQLNSIGGVNDGVFLMPDETGDAITRLTAFVVAPDMGSEVLLGELRARIDAVFLPRPLYFVDALPRNATGKLPRDVLLQFAQTCASRAKRKNVG